MVFNDKTYDRIKWVAQYLLPALATLWMALAKIWGFPYGIEIGATISAIDLFLGAVLGISSSHYEGDGSLVINTDDPEKDVYSLQLNDGIADLAAKKKITFMVDNQVKE